MEGLAVAGFDVLSASKIISSAFHLYLALNWICKINEQIKEIQTADFVYLDLNYIRFIL